MSPGAAPEDSPSGPAASPEPEPGSDRAVREGVAATTEGAAALVPGGRREERPAGEGERSGVSAERRLRLQSLAGVTVLGSDGRTVGRVRDIYQQDDSGELAAITVMPRQLSSRAVLIPSAAIGALPAEQPEHPTAGGAASEAAASAADAEEDEPAGPRAADAVRLCIGANVARAGLRPPDTGHATVELLREAEVALGLRTGGHVEA